MQHAETTIIAATSSILKVTIVEDDSQIAGLLKEVLEKDGFDVCIVGTASIQEFLSSCPKPDVLICDMNLPGGSGADLCNEALQRFPQCEIILMTGDLDSSDIIPLPNEFAFPVLRKPFTLSSFRHLVRDLAGHHRIHPAA